MRKLILATFIAIAPILASAQDSTNFPTIGETIPADPAFSDLVAADAEIEVLTSGFKWSEGPVWVPKKKHEFGGYLLFSDIPNNRVVRWDEEREPRPG